VGIGSDFDGITCNPCGPRGRVEISNLTRALLERGYSPDDIRQDLRRQYVATYAGSRESEANVVWYRPHKGEEVATITQAMMQGRERSKE